MKQMKDSGVEWIGKMPENWALNRLLWCIEEVKEKNNPIQTTNVLSLTNKLGVIPYEEKGNQGNKAKEDYSEYGLAFENTLVINSMNVLIGSVGISDYFGCVSPVYYVFRNTPNSDLRFINYIFQTNPFQKELRNYANGILEIRLRISAHDMLRRMIPYPTLSEQQAISDYLDRQCAYIDNVIEKTRSSIEEYKKLKQAIITRAVTKGVRGNRPMKNSYIEWIGEIPDEWTAIKFKYVATVKANLVHPSEYANYPQIAPDNIEKGTSRLLGYKTVGEVGVESDNHLFYKGQIIYSKIRPILNKVIIAPFDGLCSADMYPIETKINKQYLVYMMLSDVFLSQVKLVTEDRVKMPKINQDELGQIIICLPPEDEQAEIVNYLDSKIMSINHLVDNKEKLLSEFENYKKSMIYEYVTGKKEAKL